MKGKNFNRPGPGPLILVAPLDWGLGHATRSVPIIKALMEAGCRVIIAAEGALRVLLEKEFPGHLFIDLTGYHMYYSRKGWWMPATLLLQLPKVIFRLYKEHAWLKRVVKEYSIDAVISDSRPGLYHSSIPCIYITHQLRIKTGSRFTDWLIQRFHYRFINRYKECWVPDSKEEFGLAGELSHPEHLPLVPVKYLGPLSRFEFFATEKKYDLLIILSGPEPQRTIFEKMILEDLKKFTGRVLLARGLPEEAGSLTAQPAYTRINNHLTAAELNLAILGSELVISRTGYTTVMDLVKLQKKAVLVPTPGQTEQEYLAAWLSKQGLFLCISQQSFSLADALQKAAVFSFNKRGFSPHDLEKTIGSFVKNFIAGE